MKKISLSVAALISCSLLFAQSPKFGIKGGLNLSTLTNQPASNPDWRVGFNAGLLSHIHITPSFSLQPEVVYSSQGAKYDLASSDEDLSLKLNYVNIPLLLQYNFDNGFRLQGGPQVGFLTGVADKVDDVELHSVEKENFNTVDFSLPLGISYLSHSGLGVDARYNLGLTNVVKGSSANVRNSVFQFGLFYLFDNSHKAKSRR